MSPPCDMANDGNISDVLLVRCDRDELGEWNDRIAKLKGEANPDQIKKHSEWFRKLVKQSRTGHPFLPPLPDDPRPLMVQFASITTRPLAELTGILDRHRVVKGKTVSVLVELGGCLILQKKACVII